MAQRGVKKEIHTEVNRVNNNNSSSTDSTSSSRATTTASVAAAAADNNLLNFVEILYCYRKSAEEQRNKTKTKKKHNIK